MKIVIASSEAAPFAKTGGLADVCGSLPTAISQLGHDVCLFIPAHRQALECGQPIEPTDIRFDVPVGTKTVSGEILRSKLPGGVDVFLIAQPDYFDRAELYREAGEDYRDNCERFVFFCRAVLESLRLLALWPDVVHCNDWQTGLIPAYLKIEYHKTPGYEQVGSLMTIHNMAYQGISWHWDMLLTGIDWSYFNYHQMEFYGQLNLLKTGLVFADQLNTVSPQYAREIQQPPLGCGLEGLLRQRRHVLSGIVNGVDYEQWDPERDPHLPKNYDVNCWRTGKPACKAALQQEMGLPAAAEVPLMGMIGRLASQKGWDVLTPVIQRWAAEQDAQWVILGTGDPEYHQLLGEMARQHPGRVAVRLEFSNPLAHRIEAGADMFVMPSHFEPCGLNQMYSLRYGTVPVVHSTGGLADTIRDADEEAMRQGSANGFAFSPCDQPHLEEALHRASRIYRQAEWRQLVENGMRQDWSWENSARQYCALYEQIRQGTGR